MYHHQLPPMEDETEEEEEEEDNVDQEEEEDNALEYDKRRVAEVIRAGGGNVLASFPGPDQPVPKAVCDRKEFFAETPKPKNCIKK